MSNAFIGLIGLVVVGVAIVVAGIAMDGDSTTVIVKRPHRPPAVVYYQQSTTYVPPQTTYVPPTTPDPYPTSPMSCNGTVVYDVSDCD